MFQPVLRYFLVLVVISSFSIQSFGIEIVKDISYSSEAAGTRNLLDVYYPKIKGEAKDVVVFIHGGSWHSGHKETYSWLGKNFARKGVVAVIINYSLAPEFQYEQMAQDCARAVKWTKENVSRYGGNSSRIFVMGHSAGGHLGELINADPRFFKAEGIATPIRGMILDDAFGLDMNQYLSNTKGDDFYRDFIRTFTEDPEVWKKASPLTYKSNISNPHLILIGGRTYPAIQIQSGCLYEYLLQAHVPVQEIWRNRKKHIGMISYMYFGWSPQYRMMLDFMKRS
ncbi:MAG: esterase [Sphingobacteriaceae bacterium]|jgi:acetyl esterase/lipase|nr:esterase [Sphingobacteriaceae bacterium]